MNQAQVAAYLADSAPRFKRIAPLRAWCDHPVDMARWLPLSVMKRICPHLIPKKKNEGRRGRAVTVDGRKYPTLIAAAKALGIARSTLQHKLDHKGGA